MTSASMNLDSVVSTAILRVWILKQFSNILPPEGYFTYLLELLRYALTPSFASQP